MLQRSVETPLSVASEGRTVTGLIAPYGTPTTVNDGWGAYEESFARGAFDEALRDFGNIKFLAQHDASAMPLGKCVNLEDSAAGPVGSFRVSKTRAGDEYLELVRDGVVTGFSVGFIPVSPAPSAWPDAGSRVERTAVHLKEVSGVTWPAYADAGVTGIRSELLRVGATLSGATKGQLVEILKHIDAIESIINGLGVADGDDKEAAPASAPRSVSPDFAKRKLAALGFRIDGLTAAK